MNLWTVAQPLFGEPVASTLAGAHDFAIGIAKVSWEFCLPDLQREDKSDCGFIDYTIDKVWGGTCCDQAAAAVGTTR